MIVCWNCRGVVNDKFAVAYRDLRLTHHPKVMTFLKTWVSGVKADTIIRKLGFNFHVHQEVEGFYRVFWIYWSNPMVKIEVVIQHK